MDLLMFFPDIYTLLIPGPLYLHYYSPTRCFAYPSSREFDRYPLQSLSKQSREGISLHATHTQIV